MQSSRINARLPEPLASFVGRMVGNKGFYETPSEYVRDLIRRDMEHREDLLDQETILVGYRDYASGAVMASSGSFEKDMKKLKTKEDAKWQ